LARTQHRTSQSLVLATCYELDGLDVEDLSPARFILEHGLEHRLGLGGRSEELDDLLDLVETTA
jgi:hypothetical protein